MKQTIFIALSLFFLQYLSGQSHPHIIIKKSEYDSLRQRSTQWPWSAMKTKAVQTFQAINFEPELNYYDKCSAAFDLAGAAALCYILNDSDRAQFIGKVQDDVADLLHAIRTGKESADDPEEHGFSVGPAHAAFMAYITFDIMYDEMDPVVRLAMESDCDYIASNHHTSWLASKYSIEAMMELYHHGISNTFIEKKNLYRDYLSGNISDDGVYTTGPGYAISRLFMDGRSQKKIFMDVAEYQGFNEFYSNPKFRNLHEWIYGYAFTPFNRSYTFADSPPMKSLDAWSVATLRVSRFSDTAQQYAAWHLGSLSDTGIVGNILHYILCDHIPLPSQKPVSRIFRNGGAWLLDSSYHPESLAGVLWNINTENESHSHRDANSFNIVGFGDHILRNSGYDGWRLPDDSTWNWIHSTAASSNTVSLDHYNHSDFRGGGITEGITGYGLEYASGNSGPSLKNGSHDRNLLFVKPEDNVPGYFVLFDEISVRSTISQAHLYLHPNSGTLPVILNNNQVYDWTIKSCNTNKEIKVKIYLGTEPLQTEIKEGYLASYLPCDRIAGKYMKCTYEPGISGTKTISTLIYPYLAGNNTPSFNRISGPGYSGTQLVFNDQLSDYTFTSEQSGEAIFQELKFRAKSVYLRKVNNHILNYFTRKGTKVLFEGSNRYGFESEDPVSLVCTQNTGQIISEGTTIRIFYPGIEHIMLDNLIADVIEKGSDWLKIYIPAGIHHFQIGSPHSVSIKNSEIIGSITDLKNVGLYIQKPLANPPCLL